MSVPKKLSLLLVVIVAIISVVNADLMWLGVALFGIAILLYSGKDKSFEYSPILLRSASVLLIIQMILGIWTFMDFCAKETWIVSLGVQTCICAVYGYMLALLIDRFTDIKLSERWILMFSLLIALAVSGIYLFFQFGSLYAEGFPVFNYELQGVVSNADRIWMNLQLMYPPTIATFVSIPAVFVLRHWTKRSKLSHTEVSVNE